MTGDEAARALEALAVMIRIRSNVSAHEVVAALSTAMGVVRVDGPMTNAEKCRQYRHRKRHHDGVAAVSESVALVSGGVAHSESPDLTYQVGSVPDSSKTPSSSQPDLFVHNDTDTVSPKVSRKRRSRRCPDDFVAKEQHLAIAREVGARLDLEMAKFRDHEFARPISDWDAAFRNWLRNSRDGQQQTNARTRPAQPSHGVTGLEKAVFVR